MSTQLDENYAKAYNGRLGFGHKPVLLVVDMVQAYFDPACPLFAEVEPELAQTIVLIDKARATGVPVIYTNVVYHDTGVDGGIFFKKAPVLECFRAGNPMGAWPAGIDPRKDELVISKQYPSAFFGTSLGATLTSQGIDTVVTCGVTTSGCIRATCLDTVSNGFIPIIVEDACGDRHQAPHDANIFDMNAKYADVVKTDEVVRYFEAREVAASPG